MQENINNLSCEVIDSYNHIDQTLEKEWDELVIATRGSIYLTCAWSRIWWKFYGKAKTLRIFLYRFNDKLVGVTPIYIENIRIGFIKIRVARLIGAYNPPRVFDIPIVKDHAADICKKLARHLSDLDRCDIISIGPVSDECGAKDAFFTAFEQETDKPGILRNVSFGVYTFFNLPDTYDAYMKSLSKSERSNRRYYEKLLGKEHNIGMLVIRDPDSISEEMPQFSNLHATQWRSQGKLGYLNAWPQAYAFNQLLAIELSRLNRTRLIKIIAGQIPILYEYYYVFGDYGCWQLSARAEGKPWDRFSLGATGAIIMIRNVMEEGIRRIEGGVSHYDYKTRLGAKDSNISVLRIVARRKGSIFKYHLFNLFHYLYENLYYKLWYRRIQHKLPPFFQRPIWMTYIRSII